MRRRRSAAVGTPSDPTTRGFSVREPALVGPVEIHEVDVCNPVLLGDVGDAPAIG